MIEARTANTVLPKAELIFRPAQYGLLDWIFVQGLTFVLRLDLLNILAFGNTQTVMGKFRTDYAHGVAESRKWRQTF